MNKIVLGPVFAAEPLSPDERARIAAELVDLELEIAEVSKSVAKWSDLAQRARTELDAPQDLRQRTIDRFERKRTYLAHAERLRAILIARLAAQAEYQDKISLVH